MEWPSPELLRGLLAVGSAEICNHSCLTVQRVKSSSTQKVKYSVSSARTVKKNGNNCLHSKNHYVIHKEAPNNIIVVATIFHFASSISRTVRTGAKVGRDEEKGRKNTRNNGTMNNDFHGSRAAPVCRNDVTECGATVTVRTTNLYHCSPHLYVYFNFNWLLWIARPHFNEDNKLILRHHKLPTFRIVFGCSSHSQFQAERDSLSPKCLSS